MNSTHEFESAVALVDEGQDPDPVQAQPSAKTDLLQWILVFGVCGVLIFGVLAFGAVYEWTTFALEAGAAALFLVWATKQILSQEIQLSDHSLYLPAVLFAGVVLAQILLHRSAYGYITNYEAGRYIAYGVLILITAECIRTEQTRKRFVQVLIGFGVMYAFFAIAQELTRNGKIFWVHSPRSHSSSIYGSYVNRDHFAGLMEMLVPIPLVLCSGHILRGGQKALVAFCTVLMASTIFLSGSRGGMIAFAIELALFSTVAFGSKRRTRVLFGSVALCTAVLAFLIFVGKGQVLGRLGDLNPGIRL